MWGGGYVCVSAGFVCGGVVSAAVMCVWVACVSMGIVWGGCVCVSGVCVRVGGVVSAAVTCAWVVCEYGGCVCGGYVCWRSQLLCLQGPLGYLSPVPCELSTAPPLCPLQPHPGPPPCGLGSHGPGFEVRPAQWPWAGPGVLRPLGDPVPELPGCTLPQPHIRRQRRGRRG